MNRVSLHIDYDWAETYLSRENLALTPELLAHGLARAAFVFGRVHALWVHADWSRHDVSVKESFESEGYLAADPLNAEGWDMISQWKDTNDDAEYGKTIIIVTGNAEAAERIASLQSGGSEIIGWSGMGDELPKSCCHRVDTIDRLLSLHQPGISLILNFDHLVQQIWEQPWVEHVESMLDRLALRAEQLGSITKKIAYADWHMLPVLRDREGNPITHEAEGVCRAMGYRTVEISSDQLDNTHSPQVELISKAIETGVATDTLLFINGREFETLLPKDGVSPGNVHLWSSDEFEAAEGVQWHSLVAVLAQGTEESSKKPEGHDSGPALPGLWSRVGLFVDRKLSETGKEWIPGSTLLSAMVRELGMVKHQRQAEGLLRSAIDHKVLRRQERGALGRDLYSLNENHDDLMVIRDLLKALLHFLGDNPDQLEGKPLPWLLSELLGQTNGLGSRLHDKWTLQAWIGFLVEEGILLRYRATSPAFGPSPVMHIAFSPVPPAETTEPVQPKPRQKWDKREDRRPPNPERKRAAPKRTAYPLRDHLLIAVDNYAIRHGKSWVPLTALKRQLASYGDRAVGDAIRDSLSSGDLVTGRSGSDPLAGRNGTVSLNQESRSARQTIIRKERIIDMLKRMAPMGQPMGEGRIRTAMIQTIKLRDADEARLWMEILQKERLLRKERQIVTDSGQSYILTMDDPVVKNPRSRSFVKENRSRGPRRGRPGSEGKGLRRRTR